MPLDYDMFLHLKLKLAEAGLAATSLTPHQTHCPRRTLVTKLRHIPELLISLAVSIPEQVPAPVAFTLSSLGAVARMDVPGQPSRAPLLLSLLPVPQLIRLLAHVLLEDKVLFISEKAGDVALLLS